MVDWDVVRLLAAYCGSNSPLVRALGCHCVRYISTVSCHFRGCKAPLSRIVCGAISSELPLPLTVVLFYVAVVMHIHTSRVKCDMRIIQPKSTEI